MDRVKLEAVRPLQVRSGHTPVNIGLMVGSLVASIPAMINEAARSKAVDSVLPEWASYLFYAMLLLGAALSLSATWRQLPHTLTRRSYKVIVGRLVRERIGHYAVGGIMLCFATTALTSNGLGGLSAGSWLIGISLGLFFRAWQTHVDVHKLHAAVEGGGARTDVGVIADPDGER